MSGPTRRQSDLVTIERISPNKHVPRNKTIRRITPHCVAGNLSVEATLGLAMFQAGGGASTGYAIGTDGRIGLGVEETNRAWTSSSAVNDNEAITFEIANNGGAPDWRMSDAAINTFLDMTVEICKFYGYKKVNYQLKPANVTGSTAVEAWIKSWAKADEMIITLHNWYANKACPGPYFMRQIPWLVREMNKRLQNPDWAPEAFVGESATFQPLKSGSKGEEVRFVQQRLNLHGAKPALVVDGGFGPLTEAAVKAFETKIGVKADGIVDQTVWSELGKAPEAPPADKPKDDEFKEYTIRIAVPAINIRTGPGVNHKIARQLVNDKNVYTIVKEADGEGASKWGQLKSGAGWLALDHTTRTR